MNLRRVVLDVDKAVARPTLLEIAVAISEVAGVEATVKEIKEINLAVMTNLLCYEL